MNIYDIPCPQCSAKIVSTARTMDDTVAVSSCVAGHSFTRAEAYAVAQQKLKPFFGDIDLKTMTIANPKLKIKAAARLNAVQELKLMAKATPITKVAEIGIREISRQMALRNFGARTENTRAFYTTTFTREDKEDVPCVYQLVGWHGNGHYGNETTILEFYDDSVSRKPVITIGHVNEENLTEANQQKVINEILDYIKKHC